MIDKDGIRGIFATYQKYGWVLRRLCITPALTRKFGEEYFNGFGVPVTTSEVDAAWFSRPPREGENSWEIRYLGDIPYALVIRIDEAGTEAESQIAEAEQRLIATIKAKREA